MIHNCPISLHSHVSVVIGKFMIVIGGKTEEEKLNSSIFALNLGFFLLFYYFIF